MSGWTKLERDAIGAAAKHVGWTCESGNDPSRTSVTYGSKRAAVRVVSIPIGTDGNPPPASRLRLRLDKVVQRVGRDLRAMLKPMVPEGSGVVLTMTAPIRVPGKTAIELAEQAGVWLKASNQTRDHHAVIHGNNTRVRRISALPENAEKVSLLVHNPDTDADLLLDMAESLLQGAPQVNNGRADELWLVIAVGGDSPPAGLWEQVRAQLGLGADGQKVLVVSGDGRVMPLES